MAHTGTMLLLVASAACAETVPVSSAEQFQAALNDARPGDTIVLQAGLTYSTPTSFVLPYKKPVANGPADIITITTSNLSGIPAEGVRVDPKTHAAAMPKLVVEGGHLLLQTEPGAHHWRFVGIEMTNDGTADSPGLVSLGGYAPWDIRVQMNDFTFDRCFIHPAEITAKNLLTPVATTMSKAVVAGVADFRLLNSYVVGGGAVERWSRETGSGMAFVSTSGPGPFLVENNYLEAFYSPLFLGGSDGDPLEEHTATIEPGASTTSATLSRVTGIEVGDLVAFQLRPTENAPQYSAWGVGRITRIAGRTLRFDPLSNPGYQEFKVPPMAHGRAQWKGTVLRDVTVRRNSIVAARPGLGYLYSTERRVPKSWFEVKAALGLTVEANTFHSDIPTNIVFYPQNQNGGFPWVQVSHVQVVNNHIVNAASCFGLALHSTYGVQADRSRDYSIRNNLCEGAAASDVPGSSDGSRMFHALHHGQNIRITHNTILNTGQVGYAATPPIPGLVITDNIVRNGEYGWNCDAPHPGGGTGGQACYRGVTMTRNVVIDNRSTAAKRYPLPYQPGNWYPSSDTDVGWVDVAQRIYRLSPSSAYSGRGTNFTDPGVDFDMLTGALAGLPPLSVPRKALPTSALE